MENEQKRQESLEWDREHSFSDYYKILGKFTVETLVENARKPNILDLACGDGVLISSYQNEFSHIVGVDASKHIIEKAIKKCPNVEFHTSLLEEFKIDEKFDTVAMIHVLEHVIDPIKALTAAANHLNPDGVLIVFVPNAVAVNRKIAKIMGSLKDEYELSPYDIDVAGHRRNYDRESLIKDAKIAGLNVIKSGGVFFKMLSTPQMDWILKEGLWEEGSYGWGRVGEEKTKDWRREFCRACYEYGKEHPDDCNVIYICCEKK